MPCLAPQCGRIIRGAACCPEVATEQRWSCTATSSKILTCMLSCLRRATKLACWLSAALVMASAWCVASVAVFFAAAKAVSSSFCSICSV